MGSGPPCVFCAIAKGEIPSHRIRESPRALAFLDVNPISWGHSLVIPKAHAADLTEVTPEDWAEVAELARWTALRLRKVLEVTGNNLFVSSGRSAEQSVRHLHIHVVPRREGDDLALQEWWEMKVQPTSPDELSKTAAVLREKA
ncbi:MAG: HIT family protein [Euryarchaeota archaeon]|nr:HIT family protein [Euryarchaeota archaeon]MDE1836420.1 HIT family protein [Euryarchaeota archaeon]MDE1879065.1 HIT family protein [Euryarchaeota archaeon]MDE2044168.1 HIT family protein [Thermoplasmata archaeon]